jgi:hypothetical protein
MPLDPLTWALIVGGGAFSINNAIRAWMGQKSQTEIAKMGIDFKKLQGKSQSEANKLFYEMMMKQLEKQEKLQTEVMPQIERENMLMGAQLKMMTEGNRLPELMMALSQTGTRGLIRSAPRPLPLPPTSLIKLSK